MIRLLHKAMLCIAGGLLIASAAMAGVPSPATSTIPVTLTMGGSSAGSPDPVSSFTVTVRDLTNNPISGASVVIDFSACQDLRICCDQQDANCAVCCIDKTLKNLANLPRQAPF